MRSLCRALGDERQRVIARGLLLAVSISLTVAEIIYRKSLPENIRPRVHSMFNKCLCMYISYNIARGDVVLNEVSLSIL